MCADVNLSRQVEPPQHQAAFADSLALLHQPTNSLSSPTQASKHLTNAQVVHQQEHGVLSDGVFMKAFVRASDVLNPNNYS